MESDQTAAMRWSPSIISHYSYKHRVPHTLGKNGLTQQFYTCTTETKTFKKQRSAQWKSQWASMHTQMNTNTHAHTLAHAQNGLSYSMNIRPLYAHSNTEGPAQLQSSRKEHQSAEDEVQSTNMEWQTPSLFSSNVWN